MENVSNGLAPDLIVYILISKFRFNRTRSVFANYTYKRHHGISADLLSRKWGIVIDKAKWNLQSTTQDNVKSALKPLTRRYGIEFLSQTDHDSII